MASRVTKPNTALRTLPAAQSMPNSGPPYPTMVRSFRSERRISRTSAIGLRRGPHPPKPIVMPLSSWATTSRALSVLSIVYLLDRTAGLLEANTEVMTPEADPRGFENDVLIPITAQATVSVLHVEAARGLHVERDHVVVAVLAQGGGQLHPVDLHAVHRHSDLIHVLHFHHHVHAAAGHGHLKDRQAVLTGVIAMQEVDPLDRLGRVIGKAVMQHVRLAEAPHVTQ